MMSCGKVGASTRSVQDSGGGGGGGRRRARVRRGEGDSVPFTPPCTAALVSVASTAGRRSTALRRRLLAEIRAANFDDTKVLFTGRTAGEEALACVLAQTCRKKGCDRRQDAVGVEDDDDDVAASDREEMQ